MGVMMVGYGDHERTTTITHYKYYESQQNFIKSQQNKTHFQMKKTILTLLTTTLFATTTNAQTNLYSKYMQQGKNFYNKSEFLTALERFDLAYEFAKTDTQKDGAKNWKNKSRKKIRGQQADLKKALVEAEKQKQFAIVEKEKSDSMLDISNAAIAKAELMQLKVETALFDKAVKEHFPEWKGYANMSYSNGELKSEGKKILESIESIDLSHNALLRLPKEMFECSNLHYINLSVNYLSGLPSRIEKFSNLRSLNLSQNKLLSLPPEIGELSKLSSLNLSINQLSKLPPEIGKLSKLKSLNLSINQLSSLPSEIFNLQKIKADNWFEMGNQLFEAKKYQKAYETVKKASIMQPDDYNIFFNLSFYTLFVSKPQEAIIAAKKSISLAPEQTGAYTNLVLGYVLNNEFAKAKPIYLKWKDKHFPDDKRFCKEVFLQDIKDLEAAGIKHKGFKKVRKLLE